MNWLDILILFFLLMSFFGGLFTGFLRGIISLIGLIAGIFIAGRFYTVFAPALTFIHSEALANIAAFAVIFLMVMIVAGLIGTTLHFMVRGISLGWLDHL